ncbi:MAG TPA: hypothetical protein VGL38_10845 [bacterium]|jgi:tetratricopeptide (TPR) repeat protein
MFSKILLLLVLCGVMISGSVAATFDGLPQAVEAAKQAQPNNAAVCHDVAGELVRLTGTYPNSSLVPEALFLAARLEKASGNNQQALALAQHVVTTFPASESCPAAFDLAYAELTKNGADPLAGLDLARNLATALGSSPVAGRYYEVAFNTCRDAKRWQDALTLGNRYLKTCTAATPNPSLVLGLGDVALMAADTPLAMQMLESFLNRYPKLPQIVAVRAKLGQMYAAVGNEAKAKENFSVAWTTWQKNSKKTEYNQAEVAHAAALSLWELQTDPRKEYNDLTAINTYLDRNRAKRQMENLISAYTQVMKTDQIMAAQALNAIGDTHARFGDALLKQGFQLALNTNSESIQPPYFYSAPEYEKAIASYSQAFERAQMDQADVAVQRESHYAASRAFELTASDGDAVFAWAIHLYENAPKAEVGELGNQARLFYLNKTVTPLLEEGLRCKTDALAMTKTLPVEKEAKEVQLTLDMPLRPIMNDMFALSQAEIHKVGTASTELASSFKAGFQPSSTTTLAQNVDEKFAYASKLATTMQKTLDGFYKTFQQNSLPEQSVAFWDNMIAGSYYEYAAACRTMQEDLAVCSGQLPVKKDDSLLPLYTKLTKLQSKGATEEFAGLVRWHDLTNQYKVQDPIADRLKARLGDLDPLHYGTDNDTNSASRKKP